MSNSSVPNHTPNPLRQENLEKALETLRQPIAIAVLASIGLHGLLWAALPSLLSAQSKEPDNKRTVSLVELSPAEQGQLPPSTSNLALQPAPTTKTSLPAKSATKLPDPKTYNDPSLYQIPILPPAPPITYPSLDSLINLDKQKPKDKPAPKPTQSPKPTTSTPEGKSKPDTSTPDKGSTSTGGSPSTSARSATLSTDQLARLREDGVKSNQLRDLYTFNDPETQPGESGRVWNANIDSFAKVEKATHNDIDEKAENRFYQNPQKVIDFFPKDACPYVLKGRNATFGTLVKPNGTVAETKVLLTSGYKGLDIAAVEYIPNLVENLVKQKKIDDDGKFKLIRFEFNFDPKVACPSSSKPV